MPNLCWDPFHLTSTQSLFLNHANQIEKEDEKSQTVPERFAKLEAEDKKDKGDLDEALRTDILLAGELPSIIS